LEKWKIDKRHFKTILEGREKALDNYKKCQSDHQRYEEELNKIDDKLVNPLLIKLRDAQQKIIDLTRKQHEPPEKKQGIKKELDGQASPCQRHGGKVGESPKELSRKISLCRMGIQSYFVTPADKVYLRSRNCMSAYQEMLAIRDNVHKELMKCDSRRTSLTQESGTASLAEQLRVAEITQLHSKVQKIQRVVSWGSWCSLDSRIKVKQLVKRIQQLHEEATTIEEKLDQHYNHLNAYAEELHQELASFDGLKDKIWPPTDLPDNYSPYYSIERARIGQSVNLDFTLSESCSVMSTRRGLSLLGIDIHSNATEQEIAQIVENSGTGTSSDQIQKAYQHYGFDYTYLNTNRDLGKVVTIEDIDRITKQGHVVDVRVKKSDFAGHSLLIEGVIKEGNSYHVTFYDPYNHKIVALPYEELEKVLDDIYTLPSEEQVQTREPLLAKMAQQSCQDLGLGGVQY
jgi:hypothetical protein